ncbi:rhamnogalacturonan acetylesterase, partial [hydrothermal vent metagenome]
MHFKITAWTILLILTSVFSPITNGEEKSTTLPAIKILMIGDSTMATYKKAPKNRPDLTGWGQVFGKRFNKNVTVINHAKSGRSTKSFIQEGHWKKALKVKADYLIIQFGHNDSH